MFPPEPLLPWSLGKPYRLRPRAIKSAGDFSPAIPEEQGSCGNMHALPESNFIPVNDQTAYVGHRLAWEGERLFGLHPLDRRQHTYVIGKTGAGKSTLLQNLFLQDVHAGRGAGLIDPHGDLATELLDQIPPNRIGDVVYFNAADFEHPVSFNLFAAADDDARHRIASGIVMAFKSIWRDSWGPRLEYILFAAVAALLECQNTSLLGLQRLLVDSGYRDWVVRQVRDPIVRAFWLGEFAQYDPRFRREAIAPIQNKVGQLLLGPGIRNILGQVRNRIDVRYIMDHRKIFVANLSKGLLGEDRASLLGALLIAQFQQAAMARAAVPEADRTDFHLTVDEFQSFTTDSFISMLSESRKYHLCLTLGHQYLDQLPAGVAEAVFGNIGTLIAFRVGEKDAAVLSREFGGHYDSSLYSSADNHRVCVKMLTAGRYGDPFLAKTLPPLNFHYGLQESVIRQSRERYSKSRTVVESRINRWLGGGKAPN